MLQCHQNKHQAAAQEVEQDPFQKENVESGSLQVGKAAKRPTFIAYDIILSTIALMQQDSRCVHAMEWRKSNKRMLQHIKVPWLSSCPHSSTQLVVSNSHLTQAFCRCCLGWLQLTFSLQQTESRRAYRHSAGNPSLSSPIP